MRALCCCVIVPLLGCHGGAGESLDAAAGADAAPDAALDASPDGAPDAAPPEHGLRAAYFRHHGALALERVEPTVDVSWGDAEPAPEIGNDHFSVRWTGE